MHRLRTLCAFLLLLYFLFIAASHPPFLTDDFNDPFGDESPESDDFGETDPISDDNADPGSWLPILEPSSSPLLPNSSDPRESLYFSGLQTLISAASSADPSAMSAAAAAAISSAAASGHPHAQSVLAFLHSTGTARHQSYAKAFLYHKFAADAGDTHSKMALAYAYFRQEMYEEAVELYAELAEMAVASFTTNDQAVVQPIRIHRGMEEDKEALRKMLGEDEEEFQVMKFQAQRGNVEQMFHMGLFYYYGWNGLRVDYAKAFFWFAKAAAKGEVSSVEYMGEMYARGAGVERNYTKALGALTYVSMQREFPSYNGLGYLFVKGYGVKQNYTKAREYFEKASENNEPGGHYNLGVLHLKGMGVKRDITAALKLFHIAAETHQPKALYQLAKLHQKGIGLEKNLQKATVLYKKVAERGPWNLLSRWALESYSKGDIGKALLLYSRMAEMGFEVAQSNEAWILDKYGDDSMCIGESGVCTDTERHRRAHSLWWQASKQGNEHAALLIGDAHYYGRGIERDYERAAEAYMHAISQSNAQAMFNLGYMHEHGQGVPLDLHLAKRYYDQALEKEPAAKFAVVLALVSLWIRKNYTNSYLVELIDSLPHVCTRIKTWVDVVLMDEGNIMILSLFICLLTVLYLRDRRRRQASGQ